MIFLESDFSVKLLSVQKLSWDDNDTFVKPRPFDALSFRLKGNSDFSDGKETTHLCDNDMLFMPSDVGYELKTGRESIIVIHFEVEGRHQTNYELIRPKHPYEYEKLFTEIYDTWNDHAGGYYLKSMACLYKIFARIYNHFADTDSASYQKIKKSVEYLNRHFTEAAIDIPTISAISNVSEGYFRALFLEEFGTSPIKYLHKLRIDYAVELIKTGYYTIEQVSEKCGYNDTKYFSTVFKRIAGYPPATLKKLYR